MLQQTRVEAVLPYYEGFLKRFPSVAALADAPESEVLAMWSGLGYYSRARNLLRAARTVAAAGSFPSDYTALRALPGIGDYTAAAVASIAFDEPRAAVDGNVLRVLARICNDAGDIASPVTRRRFQELAQQALDRRHPGEFNQALMELGATVCVPRNPKCSSCPVQALCGAHAAGRVAELPVKVKRQQSGSESIAVAVVQRGSRVLLRQRPPDAARMAGFWELPHRDEIPGLQDWRHCGTFRHTIVNTVFEVQVCTGTLKQTPANHAWLNPADESLPLTTISRKAVNLARRLSA